MIELGFIVALGLLIMLAKLPWRQKMWVISHPVFMDIAVFVLLTALHWGTFSGVMVAAIGALFCSLILSLAKWLLGYIKNNRYYPGKLNMIAKLI